MKKAIAGLGMIGLLMSMNAYAHETINLDNNSSYLLTKLNETNDDLYDWKFPNVLTSNSYGFVHYSYDYGFFGGISGQGDVYYQTSCGNNQVETIHIRTDIIKDGEYYSHIKVDTSGASCVLASPSESMSNAYTFSANTVTFSNNPQGN